MSAPPATPGITPAPAPTAPAATTARWLVPSLAYVVLVGALGVTSKLALRTLEWPELVFWLGAAYIGTTALLVARGAARPGVQRGSGWAALSAVLAIGSMICLYLALGAGEASTVTAVSAAYPAVTLVLSALMLAERISPARVLGMALVVAGVVVLTVT